jgi:hypothetical protein
LLKTPPPEFEWSVSVAVNKDIRPESEPNHGKKYRTKSAKDDKTETATRALTGRAYSV